VQALAAEGLNLWPTYGAVYRHMLFTMPEEEYRIAGERCAVAEEVVTPNAVALPHHYLGADEQTIDLIGEAIAKVAANADALRRA
jgi:hypothetical protein